MTRAPAIQYARTTDEVSIAYWQLGSGYPVVLMPWNLNHLQLEWEVPELAEFYSRLSERSVTEFGEASSATALSPSTLGGS